MAAVKKVGQKNGEVGLLVEYLFCDYTPDHIGGNQNGCDSNHAGKHFYSITAKRN